MAKRPNKRLHRNVYAASITSFLTDVSSEMITNLIPLYLHGTLGIRINVIGLIEGVAHATASLLKVASGVISDRLQVRKWLAVAGYGISAAVKPLFFYATTWAAVAGVRWAERVGKGVRTAPRDALVADSVQPDQRGHAFGLHRAADTAGAVVGLLVTLGIVWVMQPGSGTLTRSTFQWAVLASLLPAALGVAVLAFGARDVNKDGVPKAGTPRKRGRLGRRFVVFLVIVGLFDLGNASDAFLILRAAERGLSLVGILGMLITFNVVYTLASTPAGRLSDRVGRRGIIVGGWLVYAAIYAGLALAETAVHVWVLYAVYGLYYGLTAGTAKAMVADLVPAESRATAYGTYNATLGILDLPASVIAGVLWHGLGSWDGLGAAAPFWFGAATALIAAIWMALWKPEPAPEA